MVRVEPMTTVMLFAFEVVFTILFVSSIVIVFHYFMEKKERIKQLEEKLRRLENANS
jgi:nucleoside permease NupC